MKPNLTSSLVDELRRRIVEGEIAPGEKLPSESALIAERGVSRTVVREALTRLQAEGLVHTRRGAGSFALTPPSDAGVAGGARPARTLEERLELLGYRLAIEPEAAALAASRAPGGAHLQVLRAELKAFAAAEGNPASALAHDFAFHRAVAEASGNRYLLDAVDALGPAMISMPRRRLDAAAGPAARPHTPSAEPRTPTDRFQQVAAEHAAVLAAIEEGDAMGAAAAMRAHLQNSRRRLRTEAG